MKVIKTMKATERSLIIITVLFVGLAVAAHVAQSVEFQSADESIDTHKQTDEAAEFEHSLLLGEQGFAGAQYKLGQMYDNGKSAPRQDSAEAAMWYHKAAEQGFAPAQFSLGLMYTIGLGVPGRNDTEAVKWWRKAALQGNADAQLSLGLMYVWGQGTASDYGLAHMWLSLAAADGSVAATRMLDAMADEMSPIQLVKAQRMAQEWQPTR